VLGHLYEGEICSAARALEVVGERWSLLTLRNAMFAGMTRFTEFQRSLGVAPNVLAKRLGSLVDAGLFELRQDGTYLLTEKGLDLKPAIIALTEWGDRWARDEMGRPVVYRHLDCDGEVSLTMTCADLRSAGAVVSGDGRCRAMGDRAEVRAAPSVNVVGLQHPGIRLDVAPAPREWRRREDPPCSSTAARPGRERDPVGSRAEAVAHPQVTCSCGACAEVDPSFDQYFAASAFALATFMLSRPSPDTRGVTSKVYDVFSFTVVAMPAVLVVLAAGWVFQVTVDSDQVLLGTP
jgi:DNA-binding HxlR family transcriptional regulator